MEDETTGTFDGGCLCGNLRVRVRGRGRNRCCCHCRSCRLASGAPYVAWGTFDTGNFEVVSGDLREIASSAGVLRGFCAGCGTAVTYRTVAREDELDVSLCVLEPPDALAPEFHIWTSHKLSWVVLADGLPQFAEWGLPS